MTMKFAPHIRHVRDQWQDTTPADREYAVYDATIERIERDLSLIIPRIPREEFEDMRELLATRRGVTV